MKKFGIAARSTRNGSASTHPDNSSSPFDSDRPRSVAATHEHNNKTGLSSISSAFSPRGLGLSNTSPVQHNGSFAARLNSLRQKYGSNGKRSDSPSIGQPTDVRLVHGRSPVNYITSNGSPQEAAATARSYHVPGRSSSLGLTRFEDMSPSPLGSHPVTAEEFHSVASRSADEKHFRCTIKDTDDYREAELILKGMVAEAGGKVLDATHRWPGGFFYSMENTFGENPLEDGAEAPRGGRISVTTFKPCEPISFNGNRGGMRANIVEIPPRAESRGQGKPLPLLPTINAGNSGGMDGRAMVVLKRRRLS